MMVSIFSGSTGRSEYTFTLLLFSASSLNMISSPFFEKLKFTTERQ